MQDTVSILPEVGVSCTRGKCTKLTVNFSYNSLRLSGHYVSSGLNAALDIRSIFYFLNGVTSAPANPKPIIYTCGGSIKDNIGNLKALNATFSVTIGVSGGSVNTFLNKEAIISSNSVRRAERVFSVTSRNYVNYRILFTNSLDELGFDFDITLSDIYLYEGGFSNPVYRMDYLSHIGNTDARVYIQPTDGYLLPENLPQHSREITISGVKISRLLQSKSTSSYVAVQIGYKWNPGSGSHYIFKGSLLQVPEDWNYINALRKYDIFTWFRGNATTWIQVKNQVVEDTSYRQNTSDYTYTDTFNPNITSRVYHGNSKALSHYLDFGKNNGTIPQYGSMNFILIPEVWTVYENGYMQWTHEAESRFTVM